MTFLHTLYRPCPVNEEVAIEVECEIGGEPPSFSNGFTGEIVVEVIDPPDLIITQAEHEELVAEAQNRLR